MEAKIEALMKQVETGKMNTDKAYILDYLKRRTKKKQGTDIVDLEHHFTMKPTTILARLSDLEDMGLIYKKGKRNREEQDQNYSLFYVEEHEEQIAHRAQLRHVDKFKKWITKGLKFTEQMADDTPLRDYLLKLELTFKNL